MSLSSTSRAGDAEWTPAQSRLRRVIPPAAVCRGVTSCPSAGCLTPNRKTSRNEKVDTILGKLTQVRQSSRSDALPAAVWRDVTSCPSAGCLTRLAFRLWVAWDLSGRGTTRTEDARGTPTQGLISPSILVYEENFDGTGKLTQFRGKLAYFHGKLTYFRGKLTPLRGAGEALPEASLLLVGRLPPPLTLRVDHLWRGK